jgi:hypothetical protein
MWLAIWIRSRYTTAQFQQEKLLPACKRLIPRRKRFYSCYPKIARLRWKTPKKLSRNEFIERAYRGLGPFHLPSLGLSFPPRMQASSTDSGVHDVVVWAAQLSCALPGQHEDVPRSFVSKHVDQHSDIDKIDGLKRAAVFSTA